MEAAYYTPSAWNLHNLVAATTFIFSLPVELLQCVFSFYMESEDQLQTDAFLCQKRRDLSLVCRGWRAAVRDCPILWSHIVLPPSRLPIPTNDLLRKLDRAQGAPLAITWNPGFHENPFKSAIHSFYDPNHQIQPFFDLVKHHSWREVVIDAHYARNVPAHAFLPFILQLSNQSLAKNLTTFHCTPSGAQGYYSRREKVPEEEDAIQTAFAAAASLTDLRIPWDLLPSTHPIFPRLAKLGLVQGDQGQGLEVRHVFKIARGCSSLRSLRLAGLKNSNDWNRYRQRSADFVVEPFTMNNLHHVELVDSGPFIGLFTVLLCPQLRSLQLDGIKPEKQRTTEIETGVVELLRQPGVALTRLTLSDPGLTEKAFLKGILHRCSRTLVSLDLSKAAKFTYETVEAVLAGARLMCYPALEEINLSYMPRVGLYDAEKVVRRLRSRDPRFPVFSIGRVTKVMLDGGNLLMDESPRWGYWSEQEVSSREGGGW